MGGNVVVESKIGMGTTFSIELSTKAQFINYPIKSKDLVEKSHDIAVAVENNQEDIEKVLKFNDKPGYNCLVANDTDFQLVAVSYMLKQMKLNIVHEGCNGLDTYQFVQKYGKTLRIDFILLDLDMPILSGFEACRRILRFYDTENALFQFENRKIQQIRKSSYIGDIIKEAIDVPVMVGYSGLLDKEKYQRAKKAGFDVVLDAPLE